MTTNVAYRSGPLGALLDEYERAAAELRQLLERIPSSEYEKIADPKTQDEDCRTLQTICRHVIGAGYGYADYLRKEFGVASSRPPRSLVPHGELLGAYDAMLAYTVETLGPRLRMTEKEMSEVRFVSGWGAPYDMEQILEHAIVHVLRHRRQMERLRATGTVTF